MMLRTLEVHGLRGFATNGVLNPSQPNGKPGSGLTVVVGSNNAGKSTIIEALRALRQNQSPSFSEGRRNLAAGGSVSIRATLANGASRLIVSDPPGSSESSFKDSGGSFDTHIFVVPSRRVFSPYFGKASTSRDNYQISIGFPPQRSSSVEQFSWRLFEIAKSRTEFDRLLARILLKPPEWNIEQSDSGQFYLKIHKETASHSSEGAGEGIISLFFIVDALYDSLDGHVIVIDEPELSLHPALQRKLATLLVEFSATRQIILATHSPYFVALDALAAGGTVARVYENAEGSQIAQLSASTASDLFNLTADSNNPHILGLTAQEIFFIEDNVILLEGQEDVVFIKRVVASLGIELQGNLFGWGVGGATNMEKIARLMSELRYTRVLGLLDADKASLAAELNKKFSGYKFLVLPSDDIRTKKAREAKPPVVGLLDDKNEKVRPEYLDAARKVFSQVQMYLSPKNASGGKETEATLRTRILLKSMGV